jgi:error-prone DNA polymerase
MGKSPLGVLNPLGAVARGVARPVAERVFGQLRAFSGYAFPRSHAAAFAVLTYQSAWLRRWQS